MLAAVYEANPFAPASRISAPGRGGGGGAGRSAGTRCPLTGRGRAAENPRHCSAAPRRAARLRGRPWRAGGEGGGERGGGKEAAAPPTPGRGDPSEPGRRAGAGRAGWGRALRWPRYLGRGRPFPASLKPRSSGRPLHPSELPGRSVPPAARPDLALRAVPPALRSVPPGRLALLCRGPRYRLPRYRLRAMRSGTGAEGEVSVFKPSLLSAG